MAQKKMRAGKKVTRRDVHKKKARRTKVMPLSARDAVKRLAVKATVRSNPPIKAQPAKTPGHGKTATPVENMLTVERQGADESAPIIARQNTASSMLASQMQLFTALLKWTPLGMIIRQQTLVAEMMLNMHYPKKSQSV